MFVDNSIMNGWIWWQMMVNDHRAVSKRHYQAIIQPFNFQFTILQPSFNIIEPPFDHHYQACVPLFLVNIKCYGIMLTAWLLKRMMAFTIVAPHCAWSVTIVGHCCNAEMQHSADHSAPWGSPVAVAQQWRVQITKLGDLLVNKREG